MKLTIKKLADRLDAELICNDRISTRQIDGVRPVSTAGIDNVTFVTNDKFADKIEKSAAGAVITARRIKTTQKPQLIVENVHKALIAALKLFAPELKCLKAGIAPSAHISGKANIGQNVHIGAGVLIEDGAEIGDNSVILSGCKIGQNTKIGKKTRLDNNVVIYHNCVIGNSVIIQANSTIGSTGFGYSLIDGTHKLIPHNGGVVIEDFVEIGANCSVDRAKFDNTIIGAGTKIDNLVQIGHNVIIGKCCLIAGQAGLAGSCKIGDGVIIAGQCGIADNVEVGSGTMVGAKSVVLNNIGPGKKVLGVPAIEHKRKLKVWVLNNRLPEMADQLKEMSKRIKRLESPKND